MLRHLEILEALKEKFGHRYARLKRKNLRDCKEIVCTQKKKKCAHYHSIPKQTNEGEVPAKPVVCIIERGGKYFQKQHE